MKTKITDEIREQVVALRAEGLSYPKIGKKVGLGVTSVTNIVKDHRIANEPIEARVLKPCPNPRIILVYFGERENWAKCVVRPGLNYPHDLPIKVKRVEESNEPLYRLA
jgi:hypothetical protein